MPYLVMEPDGSKSIIRHLPDEEALERYLAGCGDSAAEGAWDPEWLTEIPSDEHGYVTPGRWVEDHVLIVKVDRVVVPRPVTTRWAV